MSLHPIYSNGQIVRSSSNEEEEEEFSQPLSSLPFRGRSFTPLQISNEEIQEERAGKMEIQTDLIFDKCDQEKLIRCLWDASKSAKKLKVLDSQTGIYRFEFYQKEKLLYVLPKGKDSSINVRISSTNLEFKMNRERVRFFQTIDRMIEIKKSTEGTFAPSFEIFGLMPQTMSGWSFTFFPFQECAYLWNWSADNNEFVKPIEMFTVFGSLLTLAHYYTYLPTPPDSSDLVFQSNVTNDFKINYIASLKKNNEKYSENMQVATHFISAYAELRNTVSSMDSNNLGTTISLLDQLWKRLEESALNFSTTTLKTYHGGYYKESHTTKHTLPHDGAYSSPLTFIRTDEKGWQTRSNYSFE
jgi:hypothetical protein